MKSEKSNDVGKFKDRMIYKTNDIYDICKIRCHLKDQILSEPATTCSFPVISLPHTIYDITIII